MKPSPKDLATAISKAKPTVLDRVVTWASPEAGFRRQQARVRSAVLALASGSFDGARTSDRGMKSKASLPARDANADIVGDLPTLRKISRNQFYNSGIARGLIMTDTSSVIGSGLRLRCRPDREVLGWTVEQAREWGRLVEREFRSHVDTPEVDAERKNGFARLQSMAFLQTWLNGDSLTVLPRITTRKASSPYELGIQLVEGDRLATPPEMTSDKTVVGGIKFSQFGEPLTYFVARDHPGDQKRIGSRDFAPIPARGAKTGRINVIHLFMQERPGQARGYPFLAPILSILKKLTDYRDAELEASVISAFFTVFVTSDSGEGLDDLFPDGAAGATTGARGDDEDIKLAPGAMVDLAPGEKVETANPARPNTAFGEFVKSVTREISAATGIPFEIIFKHFESSYSASRGAFLEAWRRWRTLRGWFAGGWCQPIFETWLDEAVANNRIPAPGYFEDGMLRQAYRRALWLGDAPGHIDETKAITAARDRISSGLSSFSRESLEMHGIPFEEIVDQRTADFALLEANGFTVDADVRPEISTDEQIAALLRRMDELEEEPNR